MRKNKLMLLEHEEVIDVSPLLRVTIEDNDYLIYTKGEKNFCDDYVCYVGKYSFLNDLQSLKPVDDERILDILNKVLMQMEDLVNKGSKHNEE